MNITDIKRQIQVARLLLQERQETAKRIQYDTALLVSLKILQKAEEGEDALREFLTSLVARS